MYQPQITISKILPTGVSVTKQVTAEEWATRGWKTNGWTINNPSDRRYAEKQEKDISWNRKFSSVPMTELRKYPLKATWFKYLPGGKRIQRHGTYGEFRTNGWATQGWALKPGSYQGKDNDVFKHTKNSIKQKMMKQSWWKPKRTLEQIKQMYVPAWGTSAQTQIDDMETLRDTDYDVSDKVDSWNRNTIRWAKHTMPRYYRKLWKGKNPQRFKGFLMNRGYDLSQKANWLPKSIWKVRWHKPSRNKGESDEHYRDRVDAFHFAYKTKYWRDD